MARQQHNNIGSSSCPSYSSDEDEAMETSKKAALNQIQETLSRFHNEENGPSTSGYNPSNGVAKPGNSSQPQSPFSEPSGYNPSSNGVAKQGNSSQPQSPFSEPPIDSPSQDESGGGSLRSINPEPGVAQEDGSKNIRRTRKRIEALDRMSQRLKAMNAG